VFERLHGLQNYEDLSLRVRSSGGQNPVLMTQEHANALIELLQQSTGERKQLASVEYVGWGIQFSRR
jgi:hypothetical protein